MGRMLVTPSSAQVRLPAGVGQRPAGARTPDARVPDARMPSPTTPNAMVRGKGLLRPLLLPLFLFGVSLLLVILHQGKLLEFFFPAGAFGVALVLYWRSPAHYLGFVCWLFFLTPEVRRLADFMNGSFNQQSPIMIAPLLAVALTGLTLLKHVSLLGQRRAAPLVLIVIALFYAYIVGMVQVGPAASTYTLINWLYPVMVAFYLTITWRHYPDYHRVLLKSFVFGGLLMSVYGLIEFVRPLPWDVFWLLASKMESEGQPVPFGMRISSTMNSCGPFAVTLMTILLMSLAARGKARVVLGCVGIPALLLTSARSTWGGFTIALIYSFFMLDGKSRRRLLAGVLGLVVMAAPLMMIDQVSEPVLKRFSTMQNITEDSSYQSRTEFYKSFFASALTDIAGKGLGTIGLGTKLSDDKSSATMVDFDSGLMEVPIVMGWPGTLLYTTGVLMLMWRAYRASRLHPTDLLAISGVGVAVAIFSMMIFINTLNAVSGMFFYLGVTLPVISLRYARERQALSAAASSPNSTRFR
ncbi:O-antigen ligase family protein [Paraburkholderia sp. BCC1884]|uniref:O-antigen ligase family protein n=1 Tax=Paraburkholderia sp. BCC1884 TaxID=2562668 RepID=UPI00118237FD|nr:O-antigen ligase family protein [Paraburkholderia sp. BCC1884]